MMNGVTPPPKVHAAHQDVRLGYGQENCPPSGLSHSPAPGGRTPLGILTPKKTSPVPNVNDPQLEQPKVKNTFLNYGSPLRTIEVVSPPRTCPINFAPLAPWEDLGLLPLTPMRDFASGLAPTPSTGCGR